MKIYRLINNSNSMKSSLKKRDLKLACSEKDNFTLKSCIPLLRFYFSFGEKVQRKILNAKLKLF